MGIYDRLNNLITGLIDSAHSTPDVVKIKNRTLDGKWHVQIIGEGSSSLMVLSYLTLDQKSILDNITVLGESIKVIFDGISYTGLIDGVVSYERIKSSDNPLFKASFTLSVNIEEVL